MTSKDAEATAAGDPKPKKARPNWLGRSILVSVLIGAAWVYTLWSFVGGPPWTDVGDRGTFGDMFGGLSSLFSGLAFAGIVISIFMQREELELTRQTLEDQRKELELTRATLESQKAEMAQQNQTLARQQFENTFYQLLSYFNTCLNDLKAGGAHGRNLFKVWKAEIEIHWKNIRQNTGGPIFTQPRKQLEQLKSEQQVACCFTEWFYNGSPEVGNRGSFFANDKNDLHTYFRMLFSIISYVDNSSLEPGEKQLYASILRSQMSEAELFLAFYYCITPFGLEHQRLMQSYAFFKNLPKKALLPISSIKENGSHHESFYDGAAFDEKRVTKDLAVEVVAE